MSHRLAARLTRVRRTGGGGPARLPLPPHFAHTPLGCDAVGLPASHGQRLLSHLPGAGCVFADADHWWWIVPSGSDRGLPWPEPARYAVGAYVAAQRPRLVHTPDGATPYTPPLPLYLMACRLAGTAPVWAEGLPAPA
ncbi:hypothetical protein ACIQM4_03550 [Streptomyces sp. NPDC091272]|uniref:hypothetical protein n=1 Tax=Streptomyces sp. NPDC091272 TaxID=3365981 RepID=UPI00380AA943